MMTMDGCRGGDLVAPMSSRYLSHPTQDSLPLECHGRGAGGKDGCNSRALATRGTVPGTAHGPIREARPGGWTLVPSRTGPFAAFAGTPPSPAMRWPSVLGNLGDGGGGWGISWQKLDDRITVDDEHENEGFLSEHG